MIGKELSDTHFMVDGELSQMSERLKTEMVDGTVLRNGIGVSSSPATQTLHQWRELWRCGAGFIVTKTANHERGIEIPPQTRINQYQMGRLVTLENIGTTLLEQKTIYELTKEIKIAREEGIFVIPSITSKNPDLSIWRSMIDALASTGVPYFESTLRYPYRGIMQQVVGELRDAYGPFNFDCNEYSIGIVPRSISQRTGIEPRYIEAEANRRFEAFLENIGKYSQEKGLGMIAKLWSGRHDLPTLVATCALAGMKGITLINSYQSPPLNDFPDMEEYKRANVSGSDLRRLRNAALDVASKTLKDGSFPQVTLFASGGVAVELASADKEGLSQAVDDIILCLELGADAVQLYTAIHKDYTLLGKLVQGLGQKLEEEKETFVRLRGDRKKFTGQNRPIYRLFQINPETCIGCGLCVRTAYCDAIWPAKKPTAINKNLTTFEIHPNDCTGCGLCAKVCPVEKTITSSLREDGVKK